ncbi:MAG: hypothetical protein Q9Q13_09670 [Acidobacteriota bacterium]|nr:hypothetical protein [Acidobacteriota bacterium]
MAVDEETGLDWKVQHLARQLRRLAGVDLPIDPWWWRAPRRWNTAAGYALAWPAGAAAGGPATGPPDAAAAVVAVDRCHLLAPGVGRWSSSLLARMDERHPASGKT